MTHPPFTIEVQWHSPDQIYAAALIRDGQPWDLAGALVGVGATPGKAVDSLAGNARYLAIHGDNYLRDDPLSLADREWLFSVLAPAGIDLHGEMHDAIQAARQAATEDQSPATSPRKRTA